MFAVEETIEALANRRAQWLDATKTGDVAAAVSVLNDNAEIKLPGNTKIRGREGIHQWLNRGFKQFKCEWLLSKVNRRVVENDAVESGTLDVSLISKNCGETIRHVIDYVIVWRRDRNDEWRINFIFIIIKSSAYNDRVYYF